MAMSPKILKLKYLCPSLNVFDVYFNFFVASNFKAFSDAEKFRKILTQKKNIEYNLQTATFSSFQSRPLLGSALYFRRGENCNTSNSQNTQNIGPSNRIVREYLLCHEDAEEKYLYLLRLLSSGVQIVNVVFLQVRIKVLVVVSALKVDFARSQLSFSLVSLSCARKPILGFLGEIADSIAIFPITQNAFECACVPTPIRCQERAL